ncbi:MAG: four helix bundle protein [Vicinamibacterales bacterium]
MARTLEELPVYAKAVEFDGAVSAILVRPGIRKDWNLRRQIAEASGSVVANIEEGFQQGTDKAFARYLTISKGSVAEVVGHLRRACRRGHISQIDIAPIADMADALGKMLGGFIKYLHQCDWKDRGHHSS